MIIARCDALSVEGMGGAVLRGQAYLDAGADMLFIEAATTVEQVMLNAAGPERDRAINAWCASVWHAFSSHRQAISRLLQEYGLDG